MDIRIGNSPIAYAGNKNIKTNNKKEGCFSVNGNNQNQIKTSQNAGRNLVLASMILASLGLGSSCKNNAIDDNKPRIETVDSIGKYSNDIDSFMDDEKVAKVKTTDTVDTRYEGEPRVIFSHGYDKDGNLIKSVEIHPIDTSLTFMEQPFHTPVPEPEMKLTKYYKDRKETEEYDMGEFQRKEIKYHQKVSVDGVPGYSKTEVHSADGNRVEIYKKGIYEPKDGTIVNYHEQVRIFDENNKQTGKLNFRPDKTGELRLDEKHSNIPSNY